jgi:hypothetical protein
MMENSCKSTNKPKTVKEFFRSSYFWKPFTGIAIGIIAGFLYYHFVGCSSGNCPLTGNPYSSMIWGGMLGLFVTNSPCRSC